MKPVLTIAIPAYGYSEGVERILERLEKRDDVEILISEDASPRPIKINQTLQAGHIKHTINEAPLGAVKNWNHLISQAQGSYVWILHHDEFPIFPDGFDRFVQDLASDQADLWVSKLNYDDSAIQRLLRSDIARSCLLKFPWSVLMHNYIGSPSNIICRREILEHFDPDLKWFVDTEWFFRILRRTETVRLSAYQVTSIPYHGSIKNSLSKEIAEISIREIEKISENHSLPVPLKAAWLVKIYIRNLAKKAS